MRITAFLLWSAFAGFWMAGAIPPKLFPGIEWVGLVPFFLILLFPKTGLRGTFAYGWLAGAIAMGIYTFWFFETAPLTWLGVESVGQSMPLIILGWLAVPVVIPGLYGGLFAVLGKKLIRGTGGDAVRLALLFAAVEYVRTFAISYEPFTIGAGNIYGDNWGTNIYAYAIADHYALRQLAALVGLYGVTFVAALPSAVVFVWLRAFMCQGAALFSRTALLKLAPATITVIGFFLSAVLAGPALANSFYQPGKPVKIALVATAFLPEDWVAPGFPLRASETTSKLIKQAAALPEKPEVILLPEGSFVTPAVPNAIAAYGPVIRDLTPDDRRLIVINLFPTESEPYGSARPKSNDIAAFDSEGNLVGIYSKRFLMPFGEYMPYAFNWLWQAIGKTAWIDRHAPRWRVPGNESGVFHTPFGALGVLGCSEILSPYLARNTVRDGGEVLLYTASLSILRGSERLRAQNLALAQLRAAETRRAIVYAANGGHSFFVAPDGEIRWESPEIASDVALVEAPRNTALTPALRFENWFLFAAALVLAGDWHTARKRVE